jgi:hypothetical protein
MANLAEPSPRLRKIFICDGLTSHTLISAAAGLEARAAATLGVMIEGTEKFFAKPVPSSRVQEYTLFN